MAWISHQHAWHSTSTAVYSSPLPQPMYLFIHNHLPEITDQNYVDLYNSCIITDLRPEKSIVNQYKHMQIHASHYYIIWYTCFVLFSTYQICMVTIMIAQQSTVPFHYLSICKSVTSDECFYGCLINMSGDTFYLPRGRVNQRKDSIYRINKSNPCFSC